MTTLPKPQNWGSAGVACPTRGGLAGGVARRLRIQYPGAIYHVINRGNYRRDVFETTGAASSFEATLGEASTRFGWEVHAFSILRNHFHLALTTPIPNLGDGMHWLQTTFAVRFNRFRAERGHLFQGRYQSPLVENVAALLRVVDYIHLNPVRAGIVPPRAGRPISLEQPCPICRRAEAGLAFGGTLVERTAPGGFGTRLDALHWAAHLPGQRSSGTGKTWLR